MNWFLENYVELSEAYDVTFFDMIALPHHSNRCDITFKEDCLVILHGLTITNHFICGGQAVCFPATPFQTVLVDKRKCLLQFSDGAYLLDHPVQTTKGAEMMSIVDGFLVIKKIPI